MDDTSEMFAQARNSSINSWPRQNLAVATLEQIRYADQLRLQIRKAHLSRVDPPPGLWMTGVD
jgi:hypothetical protein